MAQALLFINGELINRKVSADGGLVDRLIKSKKTDGEVLDELYWSALGRPPRTAERVSSLAAIHRAISGASSVSTVKPTAGGVAVPTVDARQQAATARRRVFEDMFWVLLNSKEFLFNH